jgi:NADH dehydrogenase (ubiquinone) 1 beta subcomplex subunit 3
MGTIVRFSITSSRFPTADLQLRSEQWRYTGPFSRWNRFKGSFPGLGIATVAFGVYLVAEQLFFKEEHGHHSADGIH